LAIAPHDINALHNRGAALVALGRFENAIENDILVLRLSPNRRGIRQRLDGAMQLLERRDATKPWKENSDAQFHRALRYQKIGNFKRAVEILDRFLPNELEAQVLGCFLELPPVPRSEADRRRSLSRYELKLNALATDAASFISGGLDGPIAHIAPGALGYCAGNVIKQQRVLGSLVSNVARGCSTDSKMHYRLNSREKIRIGFVSKFIRFHANWLMPMGGWLLGLAARARKTASSSMALTCNLLVAC
jgi:tetratricopeptide (TPR) repeat protein